MKMYSHIFLSLKTKGELGKAIKCGEADKKLSGESLIANGNGSSSSLSVRDYCGWENFFIRF